jgi:hypothetical protein
MNHLPRQLYEWHLRLAGAFIALSRQEEREFDAWQQQFPQASADEWPGWPSLIGERPRSRPALVFSREKSA